MALRTGSVLAGSSNPNNCPCVLGIDAAWTAHQPSGSDQAGPALNECCPHVALLALLKCDYRLPYKVSRSGQYWKAEKLTRRERIARLLDQFRAIRTGLKAHISGMPALIPEPAKVSTLASLKPVEDMLDGLICDWIGIEHLEGRTVGLGRFVRP